MPREEGVHTIDEIARRVRPVAERHGLGRVRVYGSYARGEAHPDSDVDLLVSLPEGMGALDLGRLYRELTECLGKEVDMTSDGGDPRFLSMVEGDAVLVYGDDDRPVTDAPVRHGEDDRALYGLDVIAETCRGILDATDGMSEGEFLADRTRKGSTAFDIQSMGKFAGALPGRIRSESPVFDRMVRLREASRTATGPGTSTTRSCGTR